MPYKRFKYKDLEFVLDAYGDGDESVGVHIKTSDFCGSDLYKVKVLLYRSDFDTVDNREVEYIEFETDDGLEFLKNSRRLQPSAYKIWCYLSTDEKGLFNKAKERLYKKIKNIVPETVMCDDEDRLDYPDGEFIEIDTDCIRGSDINKAHTRFGKKGVIITVHEHHEKYYHYRERIKDLISSTSNSPTTQNFKKIVEFFKIVDQEYTERIKPYTLFVHFGHEWWTKYFLTEEELEKEKNRLRVLQPINLELDVINNGYFRAR